MPKLNFIDKATVWLVIAVILLMCGIVGYSIGYTSRPEIPKEPTVTFLEGELKKCYNSELGLQYSRDRCTDTMQACVDHLKLLCAQYNFLVSLVADSHGATLSPRVIEMMHFCSDQNSMR